MTRVRRPPESEGRAPGPPRGPPRPPLSREQALEPKDGPTLISILPAHRSRWEGAFQKLSQGDFVPLKSQESLPGAVLG